MLRSLTEAEQKLFGTLLPVENSRKKIALSIKEKANVREKFRTIPICSFTVRRIPMPSSAWRSRPLSSIARSFWKTMLRSHLSAFKKAPRVRFGSSLVGAGAKGSIGTLFLWVRDCLKELVSEVRGDNAMSSVDSVSFVKGGERHAVSVRNVFSAQNGRGEIVMRSVAEDQARSNNAG